MARKQWRCFFCNEVFTRYDSAAEHFGCDDACEADAPACKIAAHEGYLVKYIRKLENELRRHMTEDTELHRAIMALEDDKRRAVRAAEEAGYATGYSDGHARPADYMPSMDEALRFIKSNPLTSAEMLSSTKTQ